MKNRKPDKTGEEGSKISKNFTLSQLIIIIQLSGLKNYWVFLQTLFIKHNFLFLSIPIFPPAFPSTPQNHFLHQYSHVSHGWNYHVLFLDNPVYWWLLFHCVSRVICIKENPYMSTSSTPRSLEISRDLIITTGC